MSELIANSDELRHLARQERFTRGRIDDARASVEQLIRGVDRRGWDTRGMDDRWGQVQGQVRDVLAFLDTSPHTLERKAAIIDEFSGRAWPPIFRLAALLFQLQGLPGFAKFKSWPSDAFLRQAAMRLRARGGLGLIGVGKWFLDAAKLVNSYNLTTVRQQGTLGAKLAARMASLVGLKVATTPLVERTVQSARHWLPYIDARTQPGGIRPPGNLAQGLSKKLGILGFGLDVMHTFAADSDSNKARALSGAVGAAAGRLAATHATTAVLTMVFPPLGVAYAASRVAAPVAVLATDLIPDPSLRKSVGEATRAIEAAVSFPEDALAGFGGAAGKGVYNAVTGDAENRVQAVVNLGRVVSVRAYPPRDSRLQLQPQTATESAESASLR